MSLNSYKFKVISQEFFKDFLLLYVSIKGPGVVPLHLSVNVLGNQKRASESQELSYRGLGAAPM